MAWSTSSVLETPADARAIWERAYADADAWPRWSLEILSAQLDGPLRQGATAAVRFRKGPRMTFTVTEFEDGRLFTDEARLPLARLRHRHELEPLPGAAGTRMTNTIALDGPLAWLWRRRIGPRAERTLPTAQRAAAALARRPAGG